MNRFASIIRRVRAPLKPQNRQMGGGAHAARPKNPNAPYDGFEPNPTSKFDEYMGMGLIMTTWLWILFGFKEKGAQMFVRVTTDRLIAYLILF